MNKWLKEIRRLTRADGPVVSYCTAKQLIARGDKKGLDEARRLLVTVAARRPAWSRVPVCEGLIEESNGIKGIDGAISAYLRAIDLGERNPAVLLRTIKLPDH